MRTFFEKREARLNYSLCDLLLVILAVVLYYVNSRRNSLTPSTCLKFESSYNKTFIATEIDLLYTYPVIVSSSSRNQRLFV